MAHDPVFDSAWFKWAQAIAHAQAFDADVEPRNIDPDPDPVRAVRTEYQPKRHGFSIIPTEVDPVPPRWRLILGDIAHNYRASLDHLAWALVSRGRTPPGVLTPSQENAVYFPLCQTREEFNLEIRVPPSPQSRLKLPGIRRADAAKVRRRQPYHYRRGSHRARHTLVLLAGINNGDKHRTIQPVWAFPSRVDIAVTDARHCGSIVVPIKRLGDPIEVDTELAFVRARRASRRYEPELEVQTRVTATPSIGNRISVNAWANQCGAYIFQMLREFSDQPPGIDEIGATLVRVAP